MSQPSVPGQRLVPGIPLRRDPGESRARKDPPRSTGSARFEVLDSFRGIAAMGVAWFHYRSGWAGYLAVDFFLVLSGFVLSHGYLYSGRQLSFPRFVANRLARLYPLHLFTLITFVATYQWIHGALPDYKAGTGFTLLQQLTLTHNVGLSAGELTWNGPSWSISVEFWINVCFFLFISQRSRSLVLLILSVAFLSVIYVNTGHLDTTAGNYFSVVNSGMLRCAASFLLGILAYRLHRFVGDRAAGRGQLLSWLEVVSVALCGAVVFGRTGKFSRLDFVAPFVFFLTIIVFAHQSGIVSRLLGRFRSLGAVSYSLYLNQITVLILLMHLVGDEVYGSPAIFLPLYTAVLLGYSHLTYRFIEMPCARLCKSWFSRAASS